MPRDPMLDAVTVLTPQLIDEGRVGSSRVLRVVAPLVSVEVLGRRHALPVETSRGPPVFVSQNSAMLSSTSSRERPSETPLKEREIKEQQGNDGPGRPPFCSSPTLKMSDCIRCLVRRTTVPTCRAQHPLAARA
jgi:hypothetical protein